MQARRLPARHGFLWLLAGARLYRANPGAMTSLTLGYLLILFITASVPLIGAPLASLTRPFLVLMVANGCQTLDRRGSPGPTPQELMQGLLQQRPELLRLGGLYLVGSLLAMTLWLLLGGAKDQEDMAAALAKLSVLALMVEMPFWFSPMLTGWGGVPALKSLFFSLVSVFRNWPAFLVYGLTVIGLSSVFGAVLLGVANLLPVAALGTALIILGGLALSFVVTPILLASVYLSYRDVFVEDA